MVCRLHYAVSQYWIKQSSWEDCCASFTFTLSVLEHIQDELICEDSFNIRNCNDEDELIESKYSFPLNHSSIGLHSILIYTNACDKRIYWNFMKAASSRKIPLYTFRECSDFENWCFLWRRVRNILKYPGKYKFL